MKKQTIFILLIVMLAAFASPLSAQKVFDGNSQYRAFAPDGIPFVVADSAWKVDMLGNHRALVTVDNPQVKAVQAVLPWRRPDLRPETKKIVVIDAANGEEIKNVQVRSLTSESGTIIFEPRAGHENYYVYYLPYKYRTGWGDARYGKPWNDYLPPVYQADENWSAAVPADINQLPKVKVVRFEGRSRFDFFTSMGTIATEDESSAIRYDHPENPIIFTEDRAFPIRLTDRLPVRWGRLGPSDRFSGNAEKNEYYVWQIGVWAAYQPLTNVKLQFSDFVNEQSGTRIESKDATCFNAGGTNWDGNPISFMVNVPKDKIQALWCGIQIPENAASGSYSGKVTLTADNTPARVIDVKITVGDKTLADKGDGDLWRMARLRWLNSTIGIDNLPVAPYKAMLLKGNEVIATDKYMTIAKNGLPQAIMINQHQVLAKPFEFVVETNHGSVTFKSENLSVKKIADGLVRWTASSKQSGISFDCEASMEYDGYVHYLLKVASDASLAVKDIRLVTTYSPYASEYFMGTGFKGGFRPTDFSWNWKGPWDSYWMGNDKAGLHVEYRGGSYHGPLLNDYKPAPPAVWANDGKGSILVKGEKSASAAVVASTGATMLSDKAKTFEFDLLITPLKPVDSAKHFAERYYHSIPAGFDKAAEEGANIANIHHATNLNPFINYPFIVRDSLKDFIAHEHQFGRKVKLYYTIRELTTHTEEVYALKSLNHEIFTGGVGYGLPWDCEHLIDDYKPAWYTALPNETSDAALVLTGFSRWINYYLEGLRWMFENYKLDGIYMDDVAFDRDVMKRMRKIMAEYHPGALIDLHSNTGYSVGPANQYTGFFPYVDRLWFGESFQYNKMMPDEWFVTFAGIPYGQMSDMLQDGGNRYLGMVYGATARHSYGQFSPAPVWKLWKSFGIENAKMLGYWDVDCPVLTDHPLVKATAYQKSGEVLIAIGNFDSIAHNVHLTLDWKKLGLNPTAVKVTVPEVENFQKENSFTVGDAIPVKPKEGCLLIVSEKK